LERKFLADPVLVGRENELEELHQSLHTVLEGKGKAVFISAEAGIGKTRLVTEFLHSVKPENVTKLTSWCLFKAEVPYFPFIEAFSNYYSSLSEKDYNKDQKITSWLKEPSRTGLSSQLQYLNPQAIKDQTFSAVAQSIHEIASKNPVILLIEDIHWADSASLALMHYIARVIHDSEPVLLLTTFRSEELTSDSGGYPRPLVETLTMMRRQGLFDQIRLQGLNLSCVSKLAESMLGGKIHRELAQKISVESEGNPLFVVDSLRMMHERGFLASENNEWRLLVENSEIPAKIKDIIIQRLASLNFAQRTILDAASVIGEKFQTGLLSAIVQQDTLEVLETLNFIARSTSIVTADEDCYRFDHAKSREIIYSNIAQPLKQEYHKRIAETIDSKAESLPLSDLAYNYAKAGNKGKAIKYSLAAGKKALLLWSNSEAIKHFDYVLQNLSEEQIEEKKIALEGLGDAYYANCLFEKAIKKFAELALLETGANKLRALRKEMDVIWYKEMDPQRLMNLIMEAEKYASCNRLEAARIRWNKGRALLWFGNLKDSLFEHEEAIHVFEEEDSLDELAWVLWGAGVVRILIGAEEEKGLAEILRAIAIFQDLGDKHGELLAWKNAAVDVFNVTGLFQEAALNASNVIRLGQQLGDYENLANVLVTLGGFSEMKGDLVQAFDQMLKAEEYIKKTDALGTRCKIYAKLAEYYALQGKIGSAEEYYTKLMSTPLEIRQHPRNSVEINFALTLFFATKGLWNESDNSIRNAEQTLAINYPKNLGSLYWILILKSIIHQYKGKITESKKFQEDANQILNEIDHKYDKTSTFSDFVSPSKVTAGKEFELRFHIANVGRKSGFIHRIEAILPPKFELVALPAFCKKNNDHLEIERLPIGPFEVKTIKINARASTIGEYNFSPILFYSDNIGNMHTERLRNARITVNKTKVQTMPPQGEIENLVFKSSAAKKGSEFLIRAFYQDFFLAKVPKDEAGWRTLSALIKKGKLTNFSVYGSTKHPGIALLELEGLGLIEKRYCTGERGRGGRILQIRIAYNECKVKSYIDSLASL
jgi:predicted ATPase